MKIATPFPHAFLLIKLIADCKSGWETIIKTGPKIYSLYTVILSVTPVIMVGPMKFPLEYFGCL